MRFYTPIFNQFLQTQGQTIDEVIQKEQEATLSVDTTSFKPLRHSAKETEPRQPTVYQFSTDLLSIKAGNLLGEGCFGMVKKHLASTGEVIAVKSVCFFTKVDREDFEAEVEALRAMNRLKGFKIMDYPQPRCNAYKISYHSKGWIAMEFYNGPPLSDKVLYQLSEPPLSIDQCLDFINQILLELKLLHSKGLIHNDLKPANIVLHTTQSGEKQLKLIDFGASRKIGEVSKTFSPGYAAPERRNNKSIPGTQQTEIFSLGITVKELVSVTENVPTKLHEMIEQMTLRIPSENRPSFETVHELIQELQSSRMKLTLKV